MFCVLCWRQHELDDHVSALLLFLVVVADAGLDPTLTPESQTGGGSANGTTVWVVTAACIPVLLIGAITAIAVIKKRRTTRQRSLHQQSSVGSARSVGSAVSAGSAVSVRSNI